MEIRLKVQAQLLDGTYLIKVLPQAEIQYRSLQFTVYTVHKESKIRLINKQFLGATFSILRMTRHIFVYKTWWCIKQCSFAKQTARHSGHARCSLGNTELVYSFYGFRHRRK